MDSTPYHTKAGAHRLEFNDFPDHRVRAWLQATMDELSQVLMNIPYCQAPWGRLHNREHPADYETCSDVCRQNTLALDLRSMALRLEDPCEAAPDLRRKPFHIKQVVQECVAELVEIASDSVVLHQLIHQTLGDPRHNGSRTHKFLDVCVELVEEPMDIVLAGRIASAGSHHLQPDRQRCGEGSAAGAYCCPARFGV